MSDVSARFPESKTARSSRKIGLSAFGAALITGVAYVAWRLGADLSEVRSVFVFQFALLGVAIAIALGFEFVNGFHDTANAVATVIYTHSLEPNLAVVWSG
ncbi:MAG: inorganic phosphate transporter, partial [Acidobacteriota bacterium]|nr:inorganic phosphate transporter [Acidobacteriota bacterium]